MPTEFEAPISPLRVPDLFVQFCWTMEHGNFLYLLFGGLLLIFVGSKASMHFPQVDSWALKLGLLAFIAWWIRDLILYGIWGAEQFAGTTLRAILVMMYAVAITQLLGSVVSAGWSLIVTRYIRSFVDGVRRWLRPSKKPLVTRSKFRPPRTISFEPESKPTEPTPEMVADQKRREEEHHKREALRYEFELFFDKHRANLPSHFSEEKVQRYFQTFIRSDLSVDVYEARIRQLMAMIDSQVDPRHKKTRPDFSSVEEVVVYYNEQRQKLQLLSLDPDLLETLECEILDAQDISLRSLLQ